MVVIFIGLNNRRQIYLEQHLQNRRHCPKILMVNGNRLSISSGATPGPSHFDSRHRLRNNLDIAMIDHGKNLNFGADLVTFSDHRFWGVEGQTSIVDLANRTPQLFWDTLLNSVQASGVSGIETTFPPFNWEGAAAAYGTRDEFVTQMTRRGLQLVSGYFSEVERSSNVDDLETQALILKQAEVYAGFIRDCGGNVMVAGMPMRKSPRQEPECFFDLGAAKSLADFVNRLGSTVARHGVRLALHTEAHSVFGMSRDVDLLMLLTDPVYVDFCPDTAHLIMAGADPLRVVERHRERMVIAHWKDAKGPMPADTPIDEHIHDRHREYFCGFGTGRVDWQGWIQLLRNADYRGWAILELDAAPDPVGQISAGLQLIRKTLQATVS